RHSGHQLQMTHIVYIRLRIEAKFRDRSKHSGRVFRLDCNGFGYGAAGDSNFGEFRLVLPGTELPPNLYDVHNREAAMRPHQVPDELAVRVRRLGDVREGDAEIGKHLLDDRA